MAILKRVTGEPAGQLIELKHDVTVIGRSPECQIILDPNGVSRRHAEIKKSATISSWPTSAPATRRWSTTPRSRPAPITRSSPAIGSTSATSSSSTTRRPAKDGPDPDADVMVVTEGETVDDPNLHTLDASRSSAMASIVRPEVKLKAILEIARNLSSELRIDAVAPKILDSLMELFPQAERLFLVLVDPETKRLVRKAFKYRPNTKRTPFSGGRAR